MKGKIVNTVFKLKIIGLANSTIREVRFKLFHIAKHTDLDNPMKVKAFKSNKNITNSSKDNLVKDYNYYCEMNGIEWKKPTYKWTSKSPKVPTIQL